VEELRFLPPLQEARAHAVICRPELEQEVVKIGAIPLLSENPRETFFRIYNHIAEIRLSGLAQTVVHPSASIDPEARIARNGVVVGENVKILAGSQILERVYLDKNSVIDEGVIVGSTGFEYKARRGGGYLSVIHDGYVEVGAGCHIGAGSVIAQGFWDRPTRVGADTNLDQMVSISHGVQLGSSNLVAAGASLAGSVETGHGVWIGPGATVSNGVKLGSFSRVEIGSVVLRDVDENSRVFGNPARAMPL
jgi:UDP-3-O-[3-hydroxymyristoyl] glucosamine N-acyltransferase